MEPIAIIGIGCRFPQAKDPESFWQLLRNGVDAITEVPIERWDVDAFYHPEPATPGKMNTRWGGFLEQVDRFDSSFFGISPREVERMDPQQRLVLEVAWEALENAGIAPEKLSGSQTGVFIGIGNYDYCRLLANEDFTQISAYDGTGNTLSIAANRLSYILNLRGPSVVTETACSSSLVALHYACQSLQSGESNLCLVGGASLMLSPEATINYSQARMMASDGRCKTFDAGADGYVRGEGCGVVVLKRLADALRDEDNILAAIAGSAVNQDGQSNGLTAPNGPSQQAVIRQALANAGVEPGQISYIEAHGTGTALGDPIEFKSLKAVLMQKRSHLQPCWLGSVKTNIGHLEAAAGMASLIKVVLSLQHGAIPPHLHVKQLNPYISLEGTTFSIPTKYQPWFPGTKQRLAGISAFGFGGTNCHVVVEEAPRESQKSKAKSQERDIFERPKHLLTLAAKCDRALKEMAQRYVDFLATHSEISLADVCFTANTGRSHFDRRLAVVTESTAQLSEQLEAFASGKEIAGLVSDRLSNKKRPKIAFLFTGQGSQYIGMGRQLYQTQPLFQQTLDRCDEILRPYLDYSLLEILYPQETEDRRQETEEDKINSQFAIDAGATLRVSRRRSEALRNSQSIPNSSPYPLPLTPYPSLDETAYTQPALFAIEYALYQLWKSWGITPDVVMGHSVGEYVAACVAGVFSLEDGLKLVAERARLMQALPEEDGEMVAVFADESTVQAAIQPYSLEVAIAAINSPQSIVISGRRDRIEAIVTDLQAQGIKTQKLNVSHAFHSPLMEPVLTAFEQVAANVSYSSPRIELVSNVTGKLATSEIVTPEYWCRHLRQSVKFAAGMETLHHLGCEVFVEIGAKPILLGMGRYCLPENTGVWLPSLSSKRDDWQQLLQSLAALYVRGVSVDWSGFDCDYFRHRLQLPTYPFQRQRYWANITNNRRSTTANSSLVHLLNQGDTQQLTQRIATTGKLSESEMKLLPKLLKVLVEQDRQDAEFISTKEWFYEVQWQSQPRQLNITQSNNGFHQPYGWLIFADSSGVGESLAQLLRDRGHTCILVYPGDTYQLRETGAWNINPSNPADFERLLQEALETLNLPLQKIVHLWSIELGLVEQLTIPNLEQAQILGVGSVLHLLQALAKEENKRRNPKSKIDLPQLWLATRGAVPVDNSLPAVAQSPLWGMGKAIALEHPELWGGMVDLAPQTSLNETEQLIAEIENSPGEDHLAFRGRNRYVARLVQKQLPQSQITFRSNSTYLITGGLGALGLEVAEWMVQQGVRSLVLTGRSKPSSQAREAIARMEQAGARILATQADVSQVWDVAKVLEEVETAMPPLRGVVHAAGVLEDGILLQQNWEQFARVMAPKLKGAWNLHVLTQKLPLDFFVTFSSVASLLGSPSQGNYAAANAFTDALAHYRQALGLPGLSINWGPWSDVGMAANLNHRQQARITAQGLSPIAPTQGLQVLGQILGQTNLTQVGVLPFNWSVFRQQLQGKQLPLLAQLMPSSSQEETTTVQHEFLQQLPEATPSDRQQLLIAYLQEKIAKLLGISTTTDVQQSLHELGLDSLMAVELTGIVRAELQVDLPVRAFVEDPSIASIAKLILDRLTPGSSTVDVVTDLDLNAEAVLDPAIALGTARHEWVNEPVSILLTGATGFLGAFLLHELLEQTKANIYCIVRSDNCESGKIRLQQNLESYNLWNEDLSSRIIPVLGDLSQPQLGVSDKQFQKMASEIDRIYHNGALLSYVYPYSRFKAINVLGTQEILKLASFDKIKPVHHISSVAVFESSALYGKQVTESDRDIPSEGIYLGYSQSKWVSEKLVAIAGDRGLPVCIYRPPLISGHSQSGIWNTDGFLCRMIQGCIQMGSMPELDLTLDLSPVDYNSRAIVYLSSQQESLGKVFHLQNPYLLHWSQLIDFIRSFGYRIDSLPYEDWKIRLNSDRTNPLYPLLPFFHHKWSKEQLTYIELNQQDRRPAIGCQQTLNALTNTSINCPPLDSNLLKIYFSYLVRSGFLNVPNVAVSGC